MTFQSERRKSHRLKHGLAIKISIEEADFITQTENIGVNGALFQLEKAIPLMTRLAMTLLIPPAEKKKTTQKILCKGVVVRCEPLNPKDIGGIHRVAVYFSSIKDSDKKLLGKYIERGL